MPSIRIPTTRPRKKGKTAATKKTKPRLFTVQVCDSQKRPLGSETTAMPYHVMTGYLQQSGIADSVTLRDVRELPGWTRKRYQYFSGGKGMPILLIRRVY